MHLGGNRRSVPLSEALEQATFILTCSLEQSCIRRQSVDAKYHRFRIAYLKKISTNK